MDRIKLPRPLLRSSAVLVCFAAVIGKTLAEEYLSNLDDLWPDPTGVSIGDIETLDYSYGPFVVQFFTGSGTNETKLVAGLTNSPTVEAFELTSVTFEFWGGPSQPWSNITAEVPSPRTASWATSRNGGTNFTDNGPILPVSTITNGNATACAVRCGCKIRQD